MKSVGKRSNKTGISKREKEENVMAKI